MGRLSVRFRVCFCACVCLTVLVFPRCVSGLQMGIDVYGISGRVYDAQTEQSVRGVELTLREPGGAIRAQIQTGGSGHFEFGNVSRGDYEIVARATGYDLFSMSLTVGGGATRGMTIYLKRTASEQARTPSSVSAHELSMPQRARDLMLSGKKKIFFDKNLEGGLEDFESAVRITSDYYEAYYQIAMTLYALGKRDEAERNFRKSIELSKDMYGEPVIGMGTILLDKGDAEGGEKMIRRGLEQSPHFGLGYYELGRAYLDEERIPEAKRAAEQARSLMPSGAVVYRLLANIHLRNKEYFAFLEDIDAYLKIDPDGPGAVQAKAMRTKVLKIIPDDRVVSGDSAQR
jgi:tetratricopeptide (TPR) repeat protein